MMAKLRRLKTSAPGVLGVVVSILTAIFAKLPLIIPMDAIGASFLVSLIIGVFFGVYPAKKAAQLDPIKALQFE